MTQEEKELLLKDICARLPYGVRVCYKIHLENEPIDVTLSGLLLDYFNNKTVVEIKPYLRPMSSMSEEEYESIKYRYSFYGDSILHISEMFTCGEVTDWLNANHFDYRGLIEKGLALEAPEGMYNTKTKKYD